MRKTRSTLSDVARLAGVSLGSASRVLSDPEQVKPITRERVLAAVEQLGYVRNGAAQALASRKTRTIAAVFPTLDNPIYATSTQSLQQTLWPLGYQVLIASHEYRPARESEIVRAIVERGVDGIVLVGTDHPESVFSLVRQYGLPYVLTWSRDESHYEHCVGFSNVDAAYRMARHVVALGHREIALCGGSTAGNERARGRLAGTRAALREAGLTLRPEWTIEQPFTFEGGRQVVRQLWRGTQRPTALICGTDLQAIGAMDECRRLDIAVPDQLSITGFDDIELAAIATPPLTSVRVPSFDIGVLAARRVVALIEGQATDPDMALDAPLVQRASVKDLR